MTYYQRKVERHCDILCDVKADTVANPLTVTLAKQRFERLEKTNCYTVEEAIGNELADTSAVKTEALVDTSPAIL